MEPYLAGILAGIMAVAVVTAILTAVRKKQGRPKPEYDERQMAARGVAYRWAFLTLMLSLAVNTGVEAIWGPWAKPGVFGVKFVCMLVRLRRQKREEQEDAEA